MPNFVISKVGDTDWGEVIDVQFCAFAEEAFWGLLHGKGTPQNRESCKKYHLDDLDQHGAQLWLKVVDVGMAL